MARHPLPPAPASGGWHDGDPAAFRSFADIGSRGQESAEQVSPSILQDLSEERPRPKKVASTRF